MHRSTQTITPRAPRYLPAPAAVASIAMQPGIVGIEAKISNISVDGIAVEPKQPVSASKGDRVVLVLSWLEQGTSAASQSSPAPAHRQVTCPGMVVEKTGSSARLHIKFDLPTEAGRPGAAASITLAPGEPGPARLPLGFVSSEVSWRSEHVRSRTATLLSIARFYALGLTALCGYSTIGFNLLQTASTEVRIVFSSIGFALIGMLVMLGVFTLRFAGYVFCSNIMNRKRIVALRSAYLASRGLLRFAPPPRSADEVWVCGGYYAFPYLFAFFNFCLLLLILPFAYLLFKDIRTSASTTVVVLLLCATIYPRVCHRYGADIFIAREFMRSKSGGLETHVELKDWYNESLKRKESQDRRHQVPVLRAYVALTVATCGACIAYAIEHETSFLLSAILLLVLTVAARIMSVNFRIPRPR